MPTQATSSQRPVARRTRPTQRRAAAKRQGSFAFNPAASTPLKRSQKQARRKRARATRRAPGQAQRVQRQVVPEDLSREQRQSLVDVQRKRLGIRSAEDAERAEFDRRHGPRETREALNQVAGARRTQARRQAVRTALHAVGAPKGARPASRSARRELERLGRDVTRQRAVKAKPGRAKTKIAGLPVGAVQASAGRAVRSRVLQGHGVAGARFAKGVGKFVKNAGEDTLLLPYNAAKGAYELGAATNESVQKAAPFMEFLPGKGSHKRSKEIAKGATEGFVGHGVRAVGNAVQGDSKAAKKHAKAAVKVLGEHPVNSALEVSGVYAAAGRTAGAGARRAPKGSRARKAGSTRRADATIAGTNIRVKQSYSKNLFTAQGQRRKERERANKVYMEERAKGTGHGEAKRRAVAASHEVRSSKVRSVAAAVTGNAVRPDRDGLIRQREDARTAKTEGRRQMGREETRGATRETAKDPLLRGTRRQRARKAVTPGAERRAAQRPEQHLVRLAATKRIGTPATLVDDLKREKDRLDTVYREEFGKLSLLDARQEAASANRQTVAAIESYLASRTPEKDEAIVAAGGRVRELAHGNTRALRALEALDDDQALAAAVRESAVARYGATFDESKVDAPDQARAHEAAKEAEAAARSDVRAAKAGRKRKARAAQTAQRKAAREEGRARVLDSQGRARQGREGRRLDERAAALEARADELESTAVRIKTGAPRTRDDDLKPKKARRRRGARPGSKNYTRADAYVERAAGLRQEAARLRAEGAGKPSPRTEMFRAKLSERTERERGKLAELEAAIEGRAPEQRAEIERGGSEAVQAARQSLADDARRRDEGEVAAMLKERDAQAKLVGQLERAVKAVDARLARSEGETAPRALARLEAARGNTVVAERDAKAAAAEVPKAKKAAAVARKERQESKPRKIEVGLVLPDGTKLRTADVIAKLADEDLMSGSTKAAVQAWRDAGEPGGNAPEAAALRRVALEDPELPAFLTNRPNARGARAFFVNSFGQNRKRADQHRLTGESTRLGATPQDMRAVEEALVHQRGLIDALDAYDDFIRMWGMKNSDGKLFTPDEAEAEIKARALANPDGPKLVAVRVAPGSYSKERIDRILELQKAGTMEPRKALDQRIEDALDMEKARAQGKPNVVLAPEAALGRFKDHQAVSSSAAGKVMQKVTSVFRGTVLPFSTKWLTGNVVEALVRSGLNGITPVDIARGRHVMRALLAHDAQAGKDFQIRATNGLLFGSSERLSVHRDQSALDGTGVRPVGEALGSIARAPGVKQLLDGLDAYQRLVFGINKGMERLYQQGVIGKETRREIRELTDSWYGATRLHRDAFDDVVKGLVDTDSQVRFAEKVNEVLGKYGEFSPTTRRITQTIAPFLPWYLNAARFVYHTLPVKHPVKTAVLANVEATFDRAWAEERKALDLGGRGGLMPGPLGSMIPTKDGGLIDAARYTPFGAFTNLPGGLVDPLFPQFATVYDILSHGVNFAGRDLEVKDAEEGKRKARADERIGLAMYAFLESVLPGVSLVRRVREGGETPFDNSKVWAPRTKPNTSHSKGGKSTGAAVRRIVDPFRPIRLKQAAGGGSAAPVARRVSDDPERREAEREADLLRREAEAERDLLEREAELLRREAQGR